MTDYPILLPNLIVEMAINGETLNNAEQAYVNSCMEVADGTLTVWLSQSEALSSTLSSNYRYLDLIRSIYRNFLLLEIRNKNPYVGFVTGWMELLKYLPEASKGKALKPELIKYICLETHKEIYSFEIFEHDESASDLEKVDHVLTSGEPLFRHQITKALSKDLDFLELDCDNLDSLRDNFGYSTSSSYT